MCDSTYKHTTNPQYLPFEKTEWWSDEFEKIHEFMEKDMIPDDCSGARDYWKAYRKYMSSVHYYEQKSMFAASTLDNKCLVSSSGDGDGSYTCLVGRNEENKIISIKIDYYYGYNTEEE